MFYLTIFSFFSYSHCHVWLNLNCFLHDLNFSVTKDLYSLYKLFIIRILKPWLAVHLKIRNVKLRSIETSNSVSFQRTFWHLYNLLSNSIYIVSMCPRAHHISPERLIFVCKLRHFILVEAFATLVADSTPKVFHFFRYLILNRWRCNILNPFGKCYKSIFQIEELLQRDLFRFRTLHIFQLLVL